MLSSFSQSRNGRKMEPDVKQRKGRKVCLVFVNWEVWWDLLGKEGPLQQTATSLSITR